MGKLRLDALKKLMENNKDIMVNDNVIGSDFSTIMDSANLIVKIEPMMYYEFLTPQENAKLSYIFIQNDFLTSGLNPQYALIDFESPSGANECYMDFIQKMYEILRYDGIKLASAHTGDYGNIKYGITGSIALIAFGKPRYGIHRLNDKSSFFIIGRLGLEYKFFSDKAYKRESNILEGDLSLFKTMKYIEDFKANVEYIHDIAEGGLLRAMEEISISIGHGLRISENELEKIVPPELSYLEDEILSVSSSGAAIVSIPSNEAENFKASVKEKAAELEIVEDGLWVGGKMLTSRDDKLYEILTK